MGPTFTGTTCDGQLYKVISGGRNRRPQVIAYREMGTWDAGSDITIPWQSMGEFLNRNAGESTSR